MNPFFQSDSVGGVPISPHSPRKAAPNTYLYAPVPHNRANGQPGMISKKPSEIRLIAEAQNAVALLQYWRNAAGHYQLAQSIAQMDMASAMSPISPIRQPSTPLSPFGTPGIMYPHGSPLPHYAQNYMAFHPGLAALPDSMMPYLRDNDYSTCHVPMTPPDGRFGSPLRNHSPAPSNIYENQQSTASSYRIQKSPLSCRRADRSTANIMPRFSEPVDFNNGDNFVLPQYSHPTPKFNKQQERRFTIQPESNKREAFHTPPSTPRRVVYEYTERQDARRQHYHKNLSTPVSVVSHKPVSTTSFVSNSVEYTMLDFGVEPREIWPTDVPSLTSKQIGRNDAHMPFSAPRGKIFTVSANSAEERADIRVTKVIPSRNQYASPVKKDQSQSMPKRALEHLGTFGPRTIPKTPSFSLNLSSLVMDDAAPRRSSMELSMEMHSDPTGVRFLPTATAAPAFQNPVNFGKSTFGSTGTPSGEFSDDSVRVVPMVQRN